MTLTQVYGGDHSCHSPYHLLTQKSWHEWSILIFLHEKLGPNSEEWANHQQLTPFQVDISWHLVACKSCRMSSPCHHHFAWRTKRTVTRFSLLNSKSIKSMAIKRDRLCRLCTGLQVSAAHHHSKAFQRHLPLREFNESNNTRTHLLRTNTLGCKSALAIQNKVPETLWPFRKSWKNSSKFPDLVDSIEVLYLKFK